MYAVVEIAGRQYRVSEKDRISVPVLKHKTGDRVTFDRVLMLGSDKETRIGHPLIEGVSVEATVLDHGRTDKITVLKKKRRKGYRVTRGHRQGFTQIEITKIGR